MSFPQFTKLLTAMAFFKFYEKTRSYGGKALPSVPLDHLDYMELSEDYADYVCRHEKYIDADLTGSRKREERIALMTPEEYEADLKRVYGLKDE